MTIEIRPPAEDELRAAMTAAEIAFGTGAVEDEDWERERKALPASRALAAFDHGKPVALAGAYAFDLTVPGGRLPCAGVTWVGVMPTHRRQGILRDFMKQQLADVHGWGEPIAALWASEASIYGRFGYGQAAQNAHMKSDRAHFALRGGVAGSTRLVDADEALALFRPVYERLRVARAGMLSRDERWWKEHRLADPESWRRGAGRKFYVAVEIDGEVEGYALYRVKDEWQDGFARGEVRVTEAFATSPAAHGLLWRFLHEIDLTVRVEAYCFDPGSSLPLLVRDPRALGLRRRRALAPPGRPRLCAEGALVPAGGLGRAGGDRRVLPLEHRPLPRRRRRRENRGHGRPGARRRRSCFRLPGRLRLPSPGPRRPRR